ncbi:MAG: putative O-glycosylation ligase, exosortase A system-associated [Alphaproteobacteria bacterium]
MRGLILSLIGFTFLPVILYAPFTGVLVYAWYQYMTPDRISWGLVRIIPFSLMFGVTAIVGWVLFEKKRWPTFQFVILAFLLFFAWINITTLFALQPVEAAVKWDMTVKVMTFSALAMLVLNERVRIEAFVWVFVLSVSYFAFRGAFNTLLTGGGGNMVSGANTSFIGDRNTFAVVMLMALPLVVFLRRHTTIFPATQFVRLALVGLVVLLAIAVVGTQSRGALVAAVPLVGSFFLKSRRKGLVLAICLAGAVLGLAVAPAEWYERMGTIGSYQQDSSAMGRIAAWKWALGVVEQHPLTGGGFRVFVRNVTDAEHGRWLEAHNILFEVMGEHGYIGLALFAILVVSIYRSLGRVAVLCRERPDYLWAYDLALMLQLGLIAFVVGGMFLSIAFFPMLYDFAALAVVLRGHIVPRMLTENL